MTLSCGSARIYTCLAGRTLRRYCFLNVAGIVIMDIAIVAAALVEVVLAATTGSVDLTVAEVTAPARTGVAAGRVRAHTSGFFLHAIVRACIAFIIVPTSGSIRYSISCVSALARAFVAFLCVDADAADIVSHAIVDSGIAFIYTGVCIRFGLGVRVGITTANTFSELADFLTTRRLLCSVLAISLFTGPPRFVLNGSIIRTIISRRRGALDAFAGVCETLPAFAPSPAIGFCNTICAHPVYTGAELAGPGFECALVRAVVGRGLIARNSQARSFLTLAVHTAIRTRMIAVLVSTGPVFANSQAGEGAKGVFISAVTGGLRMADHVGTRAFVSTVSLFAALFARPFFRRVVADALFTIAVCIPDDEIVAITVFGRRFVAEHMGAGIVQALPIAASFVTIDFVARVIALSRSAHGSAVAHSAIDFEGARSFAFRSGRRNTRHASTGLVHTDAFITDTHGALFHVTWVLAVPFFTPAHGIEHLDGTVVAADVFWWLKTRNTLAEVLMASFNRLVRVAGGGGVVGWLRVCIRSIQRICFAIAADIVRSGGIGAGVHRAVVWISAI